MKFARGFNKTKTDRRERETERDCNSESFQSQSGKYLSFHGNFLLKPTERAQQAGRQSSQNQTKTQTRENVVYRKATENKLFAPEKKSWFEKQVLARLSLLGASSAALI